MASLTDATIASTYQTLIKLDANDATLVAGASGNAIQLKTGDDDTTPIYLNTDRVGIGTTSPGHLLTVAGGNLRVRHATNTNCGLLVVPSTGSVDLRAEKPIAGSESQARTMHFCIDGNGTKAMTILNDGNVGIGTDTPTAVLHIDGSPNAIAPNSSTTSNAGFRMECAGLNQAFDMGITNSGTDRTWLQARGNTADLSTNANAITLNELGGNVGIGTTAPDALLHIKSTTPWVDIEDTDASGNRGKIGMSGNNMFIGCTSGTGDIHFKDGISTDGDPQASGTINMSIKADGTVGIGVEPTYPLEVSWAVSAGSPIVRFTNENSTDAQNNTILYLKYSHANLANPDSGENYIAFADSNDGSGALDFMVGDGSGGVNFTGEAEDTFSDSRIKTNIADLEESLDKINSLKPRTFNYSDEYLAQKFQSHTIKDWQKKPQVGFVAQEIGEVFPDIVQTTENLVQDENVSYDGEIYNTGDKVDIMKVGWGRKGNAHFLAHLVKAIQELSAKVDTLENSN